MIAGLRVLVVVLLVAAFLVPVFTVAYEPGEWLAAIIAGAACFLAAAGVSGYTDGEEAKR